MLQQSAINGTVELEARLLYPVNGRSVSDTPLSKADHAAAWVKMYREARPGGDDWPLVKNVQAGVWDRFVLRISYNTAWQGLQKAMREAGKP